MEAQRALQRAARQVGIDITRHQTDCDRLRDAVNDYRSLFYPEHVAEWRSCRQIALSAMESWSAYRPRLFGNLVDGLGPPQWIALLLDADTSEEIARTLIDRRLAYKVCGHGLLHSRGRRIEHPAFRIELRDCQITLIVIDRAYRADPARNPLCNEPLTLVTTRQLAAMLADD